MRIIVQIGIVMTLLMSACSSVDVSSEPEIKYGRDVCVQCGMIASEVKFAAAYRLDGEEFIFDDIGDLVVYARGNGVELDPLQTWVHDYDTEDPLLVADAYFVPTMSVVTPMGHGVIALSDETRALRVASQFGGQVVGWDMLIMFPIDNGLVGSQSGDGMDMDGSGSMSGDG
ncbi:hypothetical protein MNBD_ACTINO02-2440 [hydrothermal vent metagenome]|uniref:Nitrous oxide reductase maturation protein, outer-membrane lipoprotein NosL n=1 Tax=hydrothermal vent metagenome TaxID=652676 RepID=A0A3B0RYY3_9ZZZZ